MELAAASSAAAGCSAFVVGPSETEQHHGLIVEPVVPDQRDPESRPRIGPECKNPGHVGLVATTFPKIFTPFG